MLEKPNVRDEQIITCLQNEFTLQVTQLEFLPLGADLNTAVYRALTNDHTAYFVKLRSGVFDPASVIVPKFLAAQDIAEIIAPLETKSNALWANLESYKVIVYPFVNGQNAYERKLSEQQWNRFGVALKKLHTIKIPQTLILIQHETFTPQWREMAKAYVQRVTNPSFEDTIARELAAFIQTKRAEILDLVSRAQELADSLTSESLEFVLCHSDIHAWNLLLAENGALYLIDWDNPIFAPKERDLMFIGSGLGFNGYAPQKEIELFYRGYGATRINQNALAYYRLERIVQDLAVECEQIFSNTDGDQDRAQALVFFKSNFLPGSTLEIAYRTLETRSL